MDDNEMVVVRAFRGLDKEAADAPCPGSKILSKGMGRGLGIGGGKGPIGVPAGAKPEDAAVACPLVGSKIRSGGMGRGLGIGGGKGPIGRATAMKYGWKDLKDKKRKKKAVIEKEALAGVTSADMVDVDVTRIVKGAAAEALKAVEALKNDPNIRRASGVSNGAVAKVSMLRSKMRSEADKQKQLGQLGNVLDPTQKFAALTGRGNSTLSGLFGFGGTKPVKNKPFASASENGLNEQPEVTDSNGESAQSPVEKAAAGVAPAGQTDPYAAFQQMAEDGKTVSKAIPGINPDVVMQGQQMGVDMTPGAIKKRLGAHEMISKGKTILRDDNQNGVPDVAEGAGGAGMGTESMGLGGQPQGQPPGQPPGAPQGAPQSQVPGKPQMPQMPAMQAAAKLRMPELEKAAIMPEAPKLPSYTGAPDMSDSPMALPQLPPDGVTHYKGPQLKSMDLGGLLSNLVTKRMRRGPAPGWRGALGLPKADKWSIAGLLGRIGGGKKPATTEAEESAAPGLTKMQSLDRVRELTKSATADAQDVKADGEGDETKPGTVILESASDTPPKKAPAKKPEKDSENEADIEVVKGGKKPKAESKEAGLMNAIAGLGLKSTGLLSRLGGAPLKLAGKGIESLGARVGGKLPSIGATLARTGKRVGGAGRFGSLVGKGMRRAGKDFARGGAGYDPKSMGKKMMGKTLQGIVGDNPDSAAAIAKLLGPAALGGGMLYGGKKLLEGEPETEKGAADMGSGATPLKASSELPRRDGFKSTNREEVFNDLSKWSLGARA